MFCSMHGALLLTLLALQNQVVSQPNPQTLANWPSKTLSCYSSLTKPDMKLICPAQRSSFCIKEESTLRQDLCGHTQYFGDMFVNSLCVYRKCGDTCTPGVTSFTYAGLTYTRTRYCCTTSYCNAAIGSRAMALGALWLTISLVVVLSGTLLL